MIKGYGVPALDPIGMGRVPLASAYVGRKRWAYTIAFADIDQQSIIAMASGLQQLPSVEHLKPDGFQSANLPSTGKFVIQTVFLVLDFVESAELDLSIA